MQKKRPFIAPLVSTLLAIVVAPAFSMGFGRAPQTAVLGQALDFAVPVRLDAGETVPPECVAADVTIGDQRMSALQVRTRVEGNAESGEIIVRVFTTQAVEEPVVAVNVSVGCLTRMSRRFVLLADPVSTSFSAPVTLPADSVPPPDLRAVPTVPPPAAAPATTGGRTPIARAEPVDRDAARPAAPKKPPVARKPRTARVPPAVVPPTAPAVASAPRLKLDVAEPPAPALAAGPSASAADVRDVETAAAAAAASAASAAAARISALELSIERLRLEAKVDRDLIASMRSRSAEAEVLERWAPYVLGLLALLFGMVAWMAFKLRTLNRERQQDWKAAAAGEPATQGAPAAAAAPAPAPALAENEEDDFDGPAQTFVPTRPGSAAALLAAGDEPEPWTQRTLRVPPPAPREEQGSRAVSIEELIDLEQQAEFFIVLGQEEAAIDLLVDHLRSTGGGSPLPYLKLLEIYRRRDEREAYDRTRARFNHRFNAVAPDWDEDVQGGRSLEDYPNIIARLQMAWSTPLDAMAELESLLFRKSRGELFDMPAYRDLLFLYSLCRDLMDREPVDAGNVDVLLPLTEGATFTEPMPLDESPEAMPTGLPDFEMQPTVPVDLDLTQPAMPDSIFGDLTQPLRRR